MLLNMPQCTAQSPTVKKNPAQNVNGAAVKKHFRRLIGFDFVLIVTI